MAVGSLDWDEAAQQWVIRAKPHVTIRLKRALPRIYAGSLGELRMSDTPDMAAELVWVGSRWPLEMDQRVQERLERRHGEYEARQRTVEAVLSGERRTGLMLDPGRPPRDYQLEAADLVLATGRGLIVHAVGLGKSFTSLLVLREDDALPGVVVTLGGALPRQWVKQVGLAFPEMKAYVLPTGDTDDALRIMKKKIGTPDVVVLPYSRLDKWSPYLLDHGQTVIYDEIQELRHDGTAKYRAAQAISHNAAFKVGLTATPIYNYGDEIWNIAEVLEPDVLGDRTEFLREWGGTLIGRAGNHTMEEVGPLSVYLAELGFMHRKSRADVGRVMVEPERIEQEIDIDQEWMDAELQDISGIAERFLEPGLRGIERMQAGRDLDYRLREATGIAKARGVAALVHLLLQSEERVLLFGWHHAVYEIWKSALAGYRPVLYTGQQSPSQKQHALDAFSGGDARVMMMSLRAGAGIDGLQDFCDVAVFGELDWSPGVHTQNLGRIARDLMNGEVKERLCVGYFCVCDSGADPIMMDILGLKSQQVDTFLDPEAEVADELPEIPTNRIESLARSILGRVRSGVGDALNSSHTQSGA